MANYNPQIMSRGQFSQGLPRMPQTNAAPAGTFMPGTKVQVGQHRVIIDRYLSEGGFAHVYVVTLPRPIDGQEKAVLKRVAVPDKEHLANMRTEVETMKRLRGHKEIVKYIDSHASPLKAGGFEVFLLMEFCQGGGLIDFMNTRLQNRLTEPEILKIFTDVAEGVACMHYLKPPLLHRDLKVENVLITNEGGKRVFKVCDFGSAAPPRPAATSAAEGRLIEDDVQRHTTLQYRSPEMIDVYRKQPIDEKSDIWALGVFLYKLCYYTTPFEEVGQMAILNASFKFPGYPRFSDQLKLLIASMLREQPSERPNIYQVLQKACKMDGREVRVRDVYMERSQSEGRTTKAPPRPDGSQSRAGATLSPPTQEAIAGVPDIAPMRRGRPSRPVSHHNSAKPSPSPLRMMEEHDPFTQLDGNRNGGDELSHKFPTLGEFSLLSDKDSKFAFQSNSAHQAQSIDDRFTERVTAALADEAFVRAPSPEKIKPAVTPKPSANLMKQNIEQSSEMSNKPISSIPPRSSKMVSTGTMTSPTSTSPSLKSLADRPIHRFPPKEAAQDSKPLPPRPTSSRPPIISTKSGSRLATLLKQDAARSQESNERPQTTSSTRPSMDGGRPAMRDLNIGVNRSRSLNTRARPVSVNIGAGPTHIRDKEIRKPEFDDTLGKSDAIFSETAVTESDRNIVSDVDFLKAREEEEKERNRHIRRNLSGSRHSKRASLPSAALSVPKHLIVGVGRFGDALKKFEHNAHHHGHHEASDRENFDSLSPIAGSEATDLSDDRSFAETEELSPEMRRELEKRHLEAEEKRVANAAAEYRARVNGRGGPPPPSVKATSIQNRVQSLLQERERPVQKTATGYGQYTSEPSPVQTPQKSATFQARTDMQILQTAPHASPDTRSMSAPASAVNMQKLQRPMAPPKPKVLRTAQIETQSQQAPESSVAQPEPESSSIGEDWESQFSKRYPSLSHFEMVDMEIEAPQPKEDRFRTREV